jgi:hypothetical protein
MKKRAQDILKDEKVYVGLEDSKKTWQLCVRSTGVIVQETSMPAKFDALNNYFNNRFPDCQIQVIYEAGFSGFGLHDELEASGRDCIVTPPHTVTEEKCQKKNNDRTDCRRLAKNLENGDYHSCFVPFAWQSISNTHRVPLAHIIILSISTLGPRGVTAKCGLSYRAQKL